MEWKGWDKGGYEDEHYDYEGLVWERIKRRCEG